MENSLLCDEDFLISSPGPSSPGTTSRPHQTLSGSPATISHATDDDGDNYLRACVSKQHSFLPRGGYVEKLRQYPELCSFRQKAVRWIIMVCLRLNLAFGTALSAVNYFDRFVSLHSNMKWEGWMMELLSLACLSIAAKFDEISVPCLHEFPAHWMDNVLFFLKAEDLDRSFHPSDIQRMELAVLRALDWRLNCVTAHSFVGPLTRRLHSAHHSHLRRAVADRAVELLVGAALDVKFLEFNPSAVALSALRCALEELAPAEPQVYITLLAHLQIPREHMEETEECHKKMEERVADPVNNLVGAATLENPYAAPSPATVITPQREEPVDCIIDIGVFFKMGVYVVNQELFCQPQKNHRKRKEMESIQDKGR